MCAEGGIVVGDEDDEGDEDDDEDEGGDEDDDEDEGDEEKGGPTECKILLRPFCVSYFD